MCTDRMVRRKGRAREGFGRSIVDELSSWSTRGWWIPVAPLSLNHHVSRRGAGATLTRLCRFAGFALEPDGEAAVLDQRALGGGAKEWISFALYVSSVPLAFVSPYISVAIYVGVSILWLVPDRRFEPRLQQ